MSNEEEKGVEILLILEKITGFQVNLCGQPFSNQNRSIPTRRLLETDGL